MASAAPSNKLVDLKVNPWTIEIVTPSDSLIAEFEIWDKTKSTALRLCSFNRARMGLINLLKRPFKIPEAHKLRHVDTVMALEHMVNAMAMPGGVSYEDYLRSCLAPLPVLKVQEDEKITTETHEDSKFDSLEVQKISGDVSRGTLAIVIEEETFQDAFQDKSNNSEASKAATDTGLLSKNPVVNSKSPEAKSKDPQVSASDSSVKINPICKSI